MYLITQRWRKTTSRGTHCMSFAPGHWTMSPRGRGYRSSGDTGEAGGGKEGGGGGGDLRRSR